ncbi:cation diffusion facilitator family transporter [Peptostreptococcus equinus]|uniref:Cation diffusion facilitator family transporter n=1 Tax=Peptostreptococcus equinus TaxID=3003601 RepID=A0ABY7JMB1_9FIRM|nr:cation diffusion facilitator family transporter [Peptostreptococcus sp. CBA3647]WAW14500.1 cation diffusion facilitator family transporter [Peptostreptococcus sp. CBA3647]
MDRKTRVALLSVGSNILLVILKIVAGILSGSISIISEAMHSGVDLLASVIAFISVKTSSRPADEKHPYGHGKMENISGFIEGLLIFIAAIAIIKEAINKMIEPVSIEQAPVAIVVMFFAAIVNFFVSRKLHIVSKEEDSQALEADSLHLKTDVYTSLGVGVGIALVKLTGISILDPIVALLVALLIIKEAYELSSNAFNILLDGSLPEDELNIVIKAIESHKNEFLDYHKLKTRKAGSMKYIDFHITVPKEMTVERSHQIQGNLKKDLKDALVNTRVNVHIDPEKK